MVTPVRIAAADANLERRHPKPASLRCGHLVFFRARGASDPQETNAFLLRFDRLGLAADQAMQATAFSPRDIRATLRACSAQVHRRLLRPDAAAARCRLPRRDGLTAS